jgi:hypothetical protein
MNKTIFFNITPPSYFLSPPPLIIMSYEVAVYGLGAIIFFWGHSHAECRAFQVLWTGSVPTIPS